ncbi:MAG: hypothetical protein ACJ759_09645 [Thermoanaerobaculia bacterium]
MRSVTASKGINGARQLLESGITAFPLLPLRLSFLARLGPAATWGLFAALVLVPFLAVLIQSKANIWLYGALGAAAVGIFLCNWGAIVGLHALLASCESFESVLEGDREEIRREFRRRICGACSLPRTVLGGLTMAFLITGALFLQNSTAAATAFSRSFSEVHYLLIFLSAFGIGVGHVCIFCLLRLALIVDELGLRRLHSVVRVYDLSQGYLRLASMCLLVYVNYLFYLYFMWLGGVRFSPLVNGLAAAVGAIVLVVYIYPQLVIHKALKTNRRRLIDEAVAHLEEITARESPSSSEQKEEIIKALDYLARVEATPTWGFQLKELAAVFIGYMIPFLTFLQAQGGLLKSLL